MSRPEHLITQTYAAPNVVCSADQLRTYGVEHDDHSEIIDQPTLELRFADGAFSKKSIKFLNSGTKSALQNAVESANTRLRLAASSAFS